MRVKTADMLPDDSLLYDTRRDIKTDQWLCCFAKVINPGKNVDLVNESLASKEADVAVVRVWTEILQ